MGEIEIGKCEFCGEDKQVHRLYLEVANKHFNDNVKGKYLTFVYYCNDCGIKVDEPQERIPEETKELIDDTNKQHLLEETRPTGEEELKNKIDDIVDDCIEWEESWDGEEESAHKSLDKPSFKDQIFNLIQEQLSLAREEACKKIYDFIESESGKSGRKEILKFVDSLTNQSKENENGC